MNPGLISTTTLKALLARWHPRAGRMACCWGPALRLNEADIFFCPRCGHTVEGQLYHAWRSAVQEKTGRSTGYVVGPAPGMVRKLLRERQALQRIAKGAAGRPRR